MNTTILRRLAAPTMPTMLIAPLLALAVGCNSDKGTGPVDGTRTETDLQFLSPAPGGSPLPVAVVSFWAVKGQNREVRLQHQNGDEFLRFEVKNESLAARPDGSAIADGDSVLITLTVADVQRFIVEFQPSGLRFSTKDPAELRLRYAEADDDFNHDGRVDAEDDSRVGNFSIWRQEHVGDPWEKLGSAVVKENKEVRANITGFTRYAIAY